MGMSSLRSRIIAPVASFLVRSSIRGVIDSTRSSSLRMNSSRAGPSVNHSSRTGVWIVSAPSWALTASSRAAVL